MNRTWTDAFSAALATSQIHNAAAPGAHKHHSTEVLRTTLQAVGLDQRRIKWLTETTEGTPRQRVEAAYKRETEEIPVRRPRHISSAAWK